MEKASQVRIRMAFLVHIEVEFFQDIQMSIGNDHVDLFQLIRIGLQPDKMRSRIRQQRGSDIRWMSNGMPTQVEITKEQPVSLSLSNENNNTACLTAGDSGSVH